MRSADPLIASAVLALAQLAFFNWREELQPLLELHPWIELVPAAFALLSLFGWAIVAWFDHVRFGEDAPLFRKLAVRVPRGLRDCGVVAPVRTVQGKTRPGQPFKVRLVTRRMRSQKVQGLSVRVPDGLRRNVLTVDLLTEALGLYERRGKTFIIYGEPRGDRGRWLFFQVLVIEISELEVERNGQRTEEEGH